MSLADPIVAVATAPGKGGVGVIRFSFPRKAEFDSFNSAFLSSVPQPRVVGLSLLKDDQGHAIDQGIVLRFDAPHSFTGEFVLEFQGHGGIAVMQAVVQRALEVARGLSISLRLANPGEFTQRAFLNDKLDLAQAEALADLIDAGTVQTAKAAAASLSGVFSEKVKEIDSRLVQLRLLLEATLDFPEEEVEFLEKASAKGQLSSILVSLEQLLSEAMEGAKFSHGLQISILGSPNVGKSSLLNALSGEEVAIVSPIAGTTRDRIKQELNIRGVPLVLVDTAGLRDTSDAIEKIGIERAIESAAQADLILHVLDPEHADQSLPRAVCDQGVPVLTVMNKADLVVGQIKSDVVAVSAKTGLGLEALKDEIFRLAGIMHRPETAFSARRRHVDALERGLEHLRLAHEFAEQGDQILDLFAEELRLAHQCLGEILGQLLPDDLLGLIFSRFCIGK